MSSEPARTSSGSWALQGCLFGSVALFIVLLLFLIFLGYRQFRSNTQPPLEVDGMSWVEALEAECYG